VIQISENGNSKRKPWEIRLSHGVEIFHIDPLAAAIATRAIVAEPGGNASVTVDRTFEERR